MFKYELRINSHPERINYLKKLIIEKDDIARNDGKIFISSRHDRGRPKNFKDRKGRRWEG